MDLPLLIQNMILPGQGLFSLTKILKRPNSSEYSQELGLGGSEARFSLLQLQYGNTPPKPPYLTMNSPHQIMSNPHQTP